ncbi:MFS general substrate transporter [Trichodelitschia bisporula]|uniref:MFS general substrate transporter n=1 Tax=Trichodelitschia bisporula TaxID=703511 RepID=A0A6G1HNG0_9PEZI|nr:MFS general substrate transporter [Trichodelitschia bisporula]
MPSTSPPREDESRTPSLDVEKNAPRPAKWSFGVLNDKQTDEVPGSVLLLSKYSKRNEPLGLQHQPARTSSSSIPSPYPSGSRNRSRTPTRSHLKRTKDGKIILDPQPDASANDPLNWPLWRRNAALLSLGFYCMVGGGMTPLLAAGFDDVADTYNVTVPQVALTTGLYMMGLGLGSVIMSPTAILFGKRPVYLATAIMFILTSVWCALSPSYNSLLVARVFQGVAVSPVECLPSATIAEIFFLHERAYRLGIYTLLLLGGKNLIPLVSAAIIGAMDWRWTFWVVSAIVGGCFFLLFFFVPETFWDRTPRPRHAMRPASAKSVRSFARPHFSRLKSSKHAAHTSALPSTLPSPETKRHDPTVHVAFASDPAVTIPTVEVLDSATPESTRARPPPIMLPATDPAAQTSRPASSWDHPEAWAVEQNSTLKPATPDLRNLNSPWYKGKTSAGDENEGTDYFALPTGGREAPTADLQKTQEERHVVLPANAEDEKKDIEHVGVLSSPALTSPPTSVVEPKAVSRTPSHGSAGEPPEPGMKPYLETLVPWNGRICSDSWLRVAARPFILYCYPAVLWSSAVYALSVGWLIVLSESVSGIYRSRDTYHFTALQTGLVYISPFIGGVLGTAVAGKVSDIIVRAMSRRNGGVYEPEFRLVMAIPVALCTTIGLWGFGWSAEERDAWIVPTVFFGVISFGCTLGSTTAITFCVDSYRAYAGEALVTLNFAKNIFHGLVFSLFFTRWLEADGSKKVFLAIGGIQLGVLVFTVPLFIFGKRARMWTVRRNLMERF